MRGERQNDCGSARTGKRVRYAGCEAHEGVRPDRVCCLSVLNTSSLPAGGKEVFAHFEKYLDDARRRHGTVYKLPNR